MRYNSKYKFFFSKNKFIDTPLRIKNFKRSKWKYRKKIINFKFGSRLRSYIFSNQKNFFSKSYNRYRSILRNTKRANRFFSKFLILKSRTPQYKKFGKIKQNIRTRISEVTMFRNSKLPKSLKRWRRFKFFYKKSLEQQKSFRQLLDNSLSFRNLKKNLFSSFNITSYEGFYRSLMQFEFRLDIFLFRLRYFRSTEQASLSINSCLIKVNSRFVQRNYILKSGDIITFEKNINFSKNLKAVKKSVLFKKFIEVDFYSNTIIILSSVNDIKPVDFLNFIQRPFNLHLFKYSFK